jgi:hypothetical protein
LQHFHERCRQVLQRLKNRDPAHWRDAWQMEHVTGKYIISDRPMTEEEWIKACGATVIDVTPPPIEDKT